MIMMIIMIIAIMIILIISKVLGDKAKNNCSSAFSGRLNDRWLMGHNGNLLWECLLSGM